jgi:hypothetical protein
MSPVKPFFMICCLTVWGVAVLACFAKLGLYAAQPGDSGEPRRPAQAKAPALPTLMMFIHPQCPCSRASVAELDRIASHLQGKVSVVGVFLSPKDKPQDWVRSDTWKSVERIPGTKLVADADGAEAAKYGAKTSGETILLSESGKELFRGGLTPSRGHEGRCMAQDAIEDYVLRHTAPPAKGPTYGCPLFGEIQDEVGI